MNVCFDKTNSTKYSQSKCIEHEGKDYSELLKKYGYFDQTDILNFSY